MIAAGTLSPKARDGIIAMARVLEERARRERQRLFHHLYPEEDTEAPEALRNWTQDGTFYSRHKYQRHLEFFDAGREFRERCFMAANRVGKTFGGGGYELAAHATGQYPDWWTGKRFERPIRAWAAGKWNETTRDVVQATLLGSIITRNGRKAFDGCGVLPGAAIGSVTWKQGVADLADTIKIRHVSGGWSTLGLKSYQQGRGSFEGTAQHAIWLDEEPPMDVYGECLIRTATTDGTVMLTFTPLAGLSQTVMQFMPKDMLPDVPAA